MKKIKKLVVLALVSVMSLGTLAGCSSEEAVDDDKVKVTLLGANFGDKSFWDASKLAVENAAEKHKDKIEVNVVDMTNDRKKWAPALMEASESDADVIITGTWDQKENLEEIAPQFPDKRYILFDSDVDYDNYDLGNVYSIGYKANESGYLAGMTAAHLTQSSDYAGANEDKTVGFVGGMEGPIVYDFLLGYIEGAQSIIPDVKVAVSWVGNFTDTAKAKELTLAQIKSQNADVVFSVAGAAGIGSIEAAHAEGKVAIGVDQDQSILFEGRPEQKSIVTSALKKVDASLEYAIDKHLNNELNYGKYEILGMQEGAIGLVYNSIFDEYIKEDFKKTLQDTEEKMKNNEIEVSTAWGMENDAIKAALDKVKP